MQSDLFSLIEPAPRAVLRPRPTVMRGSLAVALAALVVAAAPPLARADEPPRAAYPAPYPPGYPAPYPPGYPAPASSSYPAPYPPDSFPPVAPGASSAQAPPPATGQPPAPTTVPPGAPAWPPPSAPAAPFDPYDREGLRQRRAAARAERELLRTPSWQAGFFAMPVLGGGVVGTAGAGHVGAVHSGIFLGGWLNRHFVLAGDLTLDVLGKQQTPVGETTQGPLSVGLSLTPFVKLELGDGALLLGPELGLAITNYRVGSDRIEDDAFALGGNVGAFWPIGPRIAWGLLGSGIKRSSNQTCLRRSTFESSCAHGSLGQPDFVLTLSLALLL